MWGVAFITYNEGHGSTASLTFFIVWICFFIAIDIVSTNTMLFFVERGRRKDLITANGDEMESPAEAEVESNPQTTERLDGDKKAV